MTLKRVVGLVFSVAIVVGIFAYAIPRIADYSAVWATIQNLTPIEFVSLLAATVLNLFTYWLANMAALPGLRLGPAAVVTQTTTSVANTLPAGGAIAVGLTFSILRSWGFTAQSITLYIGVTGVWNVFVKLALPVVSLALLALTGQVSPALVVASIVGLAVLIVAVVLFSLALSSKEFARRIGEGLGRLVSWFRKRFRKAAVTGWGEHAVAFRRRTIVLVAGRWIRITLTTIASQLALWLVLLLCLRHVGISEQEVSTLQTLAVFAFGRLLGAIPITPGGLGVIELGYIGGLVAAGGNEAQVVAAVLLFRALTYGIQIPIGAFTYLIWRAKRSWRLEIHPDIAGEAQLEPEAEVGTDFLPA
ncbi:MAG TPA: lysylphosphatidylglycerol synthase transmembrane domain-containing protein [Actinomycetota bacterium]|nr:lysylphosphatidylglycerol synthase transmembrane domain-containing protein [Actinomycetota bacterium]